MPEGTDQEANSSNQEAKQEGSDQQKKAEDLGDYTPIRKITRLQAELKEAVKEEKSNERAENTREGEEPKGQAPT